MRFPFRSSLALLYASAIALMSLTPATSFAQTAAQRTEAAPAAPPAFPVIRLNQSVRGEEAIRDLGAKLPEVAARYGKSAQEMREQLRTDPSAWIDRSGRLFYVESTVGATGASSAAPAAAIYPAEQTFFLHSRPNSNRKIYLDFTGPTTSGTAWNSSYNIEPIQNTRFDTDGVPGTFSSGELAMVQNIWKRVAEDYVAFDVDVTTEAPPVDQMTRSSTADTTFGVRVVITRNFTAGTAAGNCNCGGFAYVGIYGMTSEFYKPAFVFHDMLGNGEKAIAEAVTHEAGHTLGLSHDGTSSVGYYEGHGSGATGWAPIMGVGYYKELVQFSKGEYFNANNKEDDYLVMQNNGVTFAADDVGNTTATAATLTAALQNGVNVFNASGVIGTPTDADVFKLTAGAGTLTIAANPFELSPNLDILLQLLNANGTVVAQVNPTEQLNGQLTFNVPATGVYYVSIRGTGKGSPLSTGYSIYGSLGRYGVSISAAVPATGGIAPKAVIASSATTGPAPLTVSFSGASSTDADGSIVKFEWNFGDGSAPVTGVNASRTYSTPGSYSASLKVTDNSGMTDVKSVLIQPTGTSSQTSMAVQNIAMSVVEQSGGTAYAQARVAIKDINGNVVSGATVTGNWSGLVTGAVSALTDTTGIATLNSASTGAASGTFGFSVTNVTASGYAYNPRANTMSTNAINR